MNPKCIELLSAVFLLIGGVILAFSLDVVIKELQLAIQYLSASIETIASSGPAIVFTGLDERSKRAERVSRRWVTGGLLCLVISAALAIWGIYAT
jgi:hypothetical protein